MSEKVERLAWELASNLDKVVMQALAARMTRVDDRSDRTETYYLDGKPLVTFYELEMKTIPAEDGSTKHIATRRYVIHP